MEKIKYKIYKGRMEPITEIRKSEIILHEGYLEHITDYSYTPYSSDSFDYSKSAMLIPKEQITLQLSESIHADDTEQEAVPIIFLLVSGGWQECIWIDTMENAYAVYNKIKKWLLT
jgi:hypothetical protein